MKDNPLTAANCKLVIKIARSERLVSQQAAAKAARRGFNDGHVKSLNPNSISPGDNAWGVGSAQVNCNGAASVTSMVANGVTVQATFSIY